MDVLDISESLKSSRFLAVKTIMVDIIFISNSLQTLIAVSL